MQARGKRLVTSAAAVALAVGAAAGYQLVSSGRDAPRVAAAQIRNLSAVHPTTTPIKNVVVIFDENISFDHYFGTYPYAPNPKGEPRFVAAPGTPTVNGLTPGLLHHNRNAYNPTRLNRRQAVTCDQNHATLPEQKAVNHGLMDKFVENTDSGDCTATYTGEYYRKGLVMDYYDGNTVTGLWNYAQRFALNDNSYGTVYGPSTPGAIDLVSGQTHGLVATGDTPNVVDHTMVGDPDPTGDPCGKGVTVTMTGKNVGDLLNTKKVTWGWFEGGFKPTSRDADGKPVCGAQHANVAGGATSDYIAHHEPFQYYRTTANPMHLAPSSVAKVGATDRANHQYDLSDFWDAADAGHLPEVSFLKAPGYQDGHAGYSDPLDEQHFLVDTINHIQKLPQWKNTAVVVAYDDSDGWYDHQMGPNLLHSANKDVDALSGEGQCGEVTTSFDATGRCGYGPRLPLLVISPYAKRNYVDHGLTDQTSVLRFIEDNWRVGRIGKGSPDVLAGSMGGMFSFRGKPDTRPYLLDPDTGVPSR